MSTIKYDTQYMSQLVETPPKCPSLNNTVAILKAKIKRELHSDSKIIPLVKESNTPGHEQQLG